MSGDEFLRSTREHPALPGAGSAPGRTSSRVGCVCGWQLLAEALDGGLELNPGLSHPFRAPRYHPAEAVERLRTDLRAEWEGSLCVQPVGDDDWYRVQIERVLRAFDQAADRNWCVVTALEPPLDEELARSVHVPVRRTPAPAHRTGHD